MRKRSIHTINANQESGKEDTVWIFLADYSLDEFMQMVEGGNELVARMLFQELGIPQEFLNPIILTLTDFAQQAIMNAHPGTPSLLRLFCQEKMLKAVNLAESIHPKPTVAGPEIIHQSHPIMSGGWGYFLIDRSKYIPENRPESSLNLIELYLFREGK